MKKKNITTNNVFKSIGIAIERFHMTLFIIIIVGGLVAAVMVLNGILQQSSDTNGYTSNLGINGFDQTTINRLNQLHTSDEAPTAITLPSGRINPFSE